MASLKRWGKVDSMGQKLMDFTASIEATDARTITLTLKEPYGLVLESIAKMSSYVPFMMPKRLAETPPDKPIPEQIGSGPFKFVAAEFQPGVKAVYEKNKDYVPRKEPASWTAGGKIAKVDRVEWITMPDAQTAVNALQTGDIDFLEITPWDLLPMLEANREIKVEVLNKLGYQAIGRMNFLHPPFDNPKGSPRRLHGHQPEGFHGRDGRQRQIFRAVRRAVRVRHAAGDRCRLRRAGEGQRHGGGEEAAEGIRL